MKIKFYNVGTRKSQRKLHFSGFKYWFIQNETKQYDILGVFFEYIKKSIQYFSQRLNYMRLHTYMKLLLSKNPLVIIFFIFFVNANGYVYI